jgi:predicted O-methyltransferase YrrM
VAPRGRTTPSKKTSRARSKPSGRRKPAQVKPALGTTKPADPATVRSIVDRLIARGSMVAASDGSTHDVRAVAISAAEGEALTRWVVRERATRTIEIGLGYGVSALCICEGLIRTGDRDARHVVLDPFQGRRFADCGLQVLAEAGVAPLVEWHAEISQIALPAFVGEGRRFDLGFVDGNHRFDGVFLDLFYLGRLLRPGGVVVVDDYDLPAIRRAVSFFLTNRAWRVEEESSRDDDHHWVVVRTAEQDDDRPYRHFVDF